MRPIASRRNTKSPAPGGGDQGVRQLGRQLQTADSLADAGSDKFNAVKARVEKEKAKAAGYSAMSGLSDRAKEEKLISQYETDELMKEYMGKVKK